MNCTKRSRGAPNLARIELVQRPIAQVLLYAEVTSRSRTDATRIEVEEDVEFDLTPDLLEALKEKLTPDDDYLEPPAHPAGA
ncbi:MAG: hypothetical protein M9894_34230 [Planctomycetes bacterium]|nr:hypothetical protein [Planctomycetota bacterium]